MVRTVLLVLAAASFAVGCVSYGVYQSPETVEPGSTEVGLGTMLAYSPDRQEDDPVVVPIESAILVRHGLARNVDLGGRAWFFPATMFEDGAVVIGLYGDVRYRFIEGPVMLTGSVGVSAMKAGEFLSLGVYPALLAGTERFYGGVRLIYVGVRHGDDEGDSELLTADGPLIGLVTGASFGNRWMLRPEINLYFADGFSTLLVTPGVSLQYRFGDG